MNKLLFRTEPKSGQSETTWSKRATAENNVGGKTFAMPDKHALAQYAITGVLGSSYYVDARTDLNRLKDLMDKNNPIFIAKTAIYAYKNGFIKDAPVVMLAYLATKDIEVFKAAFPHIVDNGKQLRNFCQVIRSGQMGRKSFGNALKKQIQNWLNTATPKQLINASIGNAPSLGDIIKMVHPKPKEAWRDAFFAWCIGKEYNPKDLPQELQDYYAFKNGDGTGELPKVPFQMYTSLNLTTDGWTAIARNMTYQQLRQNLNTLERNDVFNNRSMIKYVADRLANEEDVRRSRLMPYQTLAAYKAFGGDSMIKRALSTACDFSLSSVPEFDGETLVLVDTSGSMGSPITGSRGSSSSSVTCRDAAGLFASAVLFANPGAKVVCFDTEIRPDLKIDRNKTVVENAIVIGQRPGGGTDIANGLHEALRLHPEAKNVIIVSDNESWGAWQGRCYWMSKTNLNAMKIWDSHKLRNKDAKLMLIDITPGRTSEFPDRKDILNVGGFNDNVFKIAQGFFSGETERFVESIENSLDYTA